MGLPPRPVRRLVLAPLMVLLAVVAAVTAPVTLTVAALLGLVLPGVRSRPLRVLSLVLLHLVLEAAVLLLLLGIWLLSGFGLRIRRPAFERLHYRIVEVYLRILFRLGRRVLNLRVEVEGPDPDAYAGRPLLVFCRHAGPGDSFLLVHALTHWYHREPRIVLKESLQWDPAIDVVLNRLPSRFIGGPGAGRQAADVGELARRLDDDDALVIFPEGGNFTRHRRARAIDRLRAAGRVGDAEKAEALRHVLPPRPGGVLAALDAAAGADVVWVAHTGTDHLYTVADVWRALPVETTIRMHWWQVPPGDVPAGRDEQVEWLYGWWQRIDAWIEEHRGDDPPGSPAERH